MHDKDLTSTTPASRRITERSPDPLLSFTFLDQLSLLTRFRDVPEIITRQVIKELENSAPSTWRCHNEPPTSYLQIASKRSVITLNSLLGYPNDLTLTLRIESGSYRLEFTANSSETRNAVAALRRNASQFMFALKTEIARPIFFWSKRPEIALEADWEKKEGRAGYNATPGYFEAQKGDFTFRIYYRRNQIRETAGKVLDRGFQEELLMSSLLSNSSQISVLDFERYCCAPGGFKDSASNEFVVIDIHCKRLEELKRELGPFFYFLGLDEIVQSVSGKRWIDTLWTNLNS